MERPESTDRDLVRNLVDGAVDAVVQARDVETGVHIALPSKPHRVVPRELPPDVYGFVGREGQLRELDSLIDKPDASAAVISAVSGTAGFGETALAIHRTHRVRDRFPDGDLYIDLRGFSLSQLVEATDVLAGFLRSLGVPDHAVPVTAHERASRYRGVLAGRRVLIVLGSVRTAERVRPLDPVAIHALANCGWVNKSQLLCLVGDSGTGNSDLLIALGTEAAMKGYRVRYGLATKVVNELVEAADERQLTRTIARYGRVDLLCIDGTGIPGVGPARRRTSLPGSDRTEGESKRGYLIK